MTNQTWEFREFPGPRPDGENNAATSALPVAASALTTTGPITTEQADPGEGRGHPETARTPHKVIPSSVRTQTGP